MTSRSETLRDLEQSPLDLLVIGGGIVGAGVARDAAMRGLRVGLVEQHDFAFGTSSRSSRLLHGGLRYLAQGRIGLVRQASIEKKTLHRIAPHLSDPLAFVFPTYRGTDWPLWQLRIGVKVYDLLCGGNNLGRSSSLTRAKLLEELPGLNPENLTGAVRYFDGFTSDARLVIDTLRSAENAGAMVLNYLQFANATRESGWWQCDLIDHLQAHSFTVRARAVVNATGPWAGGLPHSKVILRLTKGIHLVLDCTRLPVRDAVVITEGKRIMFLIPWGNRVVVGTTDTDYHGPLEDVRAEPEDIAYLLRSLERFFPGTNIADTDIISAWAGLRPLIAKANGAPSDISRSHQIRSPEPGWWDVAGGKLTTYRLMAEETVDEIVASLKAVNVLNRPVAACRTATEPLLARDETEGCSGIVPPELRRGVVEHYCTKEWAVHLDDVMIRRTSWAYYHADANDKAEEVARWMAAVFGWSEEERERELKRFTAAVSDTMAEVL